MSLLNDPSAPYAPGLPCPQRRAPARGLGATGRGRYDPGSGEVVQPEPVRIPVSVLIRNYPRQEIDGVRVVAGDRQLFVYQGLPTDVPPLSSEVPLGLPIIPTLRDEVEVGGKVWHLVTLEEDAARLTWQAQARTEGEG